MSDSLKIWFVSLEFPLRRGSALWSTHVSAHDEEAAAETAADWFWEQMNYGGKKPEPRIKEIYEDPEGPRHLGTE